MLLNTSVFNVRVHSVGAINQPLFSGFYQTTNRIYIMVYMQDNNGFIFTTEHPEYHSDCKKITLKAGKAATKEYCTSALKVLVKPGSTVSTSLKNVSRSGMQRQISFYIVNPSDNEVTNIDYYVSIVTDTKRAKNGALIVKGCGMDMGFSVVYDLGSILWSKGTDTPHGTRNGAPDSAGGYALKHKWI
jgi:hypothetical protein